MIAKGSAYSEAENLKETGQQTLPSSHPGCSVMAQSLAFSVRRGSASDDSSSCDRLNDGSSKDNRVPVPGTCEHFTLRGKK